MSGGCVLTVRELMGIFILESGVCQRCGGPAHSGAVLKPKSAVLLQGESDSSGSLGDIGGVFLCHQTVMTQLWYWRIQIFIAHTTWTDRRHKSTMYAHLVRHKFRFAQAFRVLNSTSTASEIILLNHRPPVFITFVYFWVMGKLYVT